MEQSTISLANVEDFKQKALVWANQFSVFVLLDSNNYAADKFAQKEWELAVDCIDSCIDFDDLSTFLSTKKNKNFGYLSYNLKNKFFKNLATKTADKTGFKDLYFFEPRYHFSITKNKITINRNSLEAAFLIDQINAIALDFTKDPTKIALHNRTSKSEYIENVNKIIQQIEAGDFYELNYCCELFNEDQPIHPIATFISLNRIAEAPFSSLVKHNESYLLCASPERYLQKNGKNILSQPIKGTIKKSSDDAENNSLIQQLSNDKKELAENYMIVDLVRNDLAINAKVGSVKVEELCQAYSFKNINQLISTISAESAEDKGFCDYIQSTFPMGSMTGAPKYEVLKNIDSYENFNRSLYAGSVGYIDMATDNFDFNVVIRSIFYNAKNNYLSIRVGSAITYNSNPEKEFEELGEKAKSMCAALNAEILG